MNRESLNRENLYKEFHCSETMKYILDNCLKYAMLSGIDEAALIEKLRDKRLLPAVDKKTGKQALDMLRLLLGSEESCAADSDDTKKAPFSIGNIYVEKGVADHPVSKQIIDRLGRKDIILTDDYRDIFFSKRDVRPVSRVSGQADVTAPRQTSNDVKDATVYQTSEKAEDGSRKKNIILAEKKGKKILKGARVCQDFDERFFYYTSMATGCIYDCDYCYLKGMYPSEDIIIYVDTDSTFNALDEILNEHEAYVCISFDTDLLAIEGLTGFVKMWVSYVKKHDNIRAECRTKCAGTDIWNTVEPDENMIFAFTLSPEDVIKKYEHGTPDLYSRIKSIKKAMDAGHTTRLCFDPMLVTPSWRKSYKEMFDLISDEIDLKKVRDISVGTFRISDDYLKNLRRKKDSSAVVWYPFVNTGGVCQYPEKLKDEMIGFAVGELTKRFDKNRIFIS
ncbi:MAG: hypothetical protein J6P16_00330 [Eubacterium sp.]|nr:hypothetical protein [Eubacterium sp.]